MNFNLMINGQEISGTIEMKGEKYLITINNCSLEVTGKFTDNNNLVLSIGNKIHTVYFSYIDKKIFLALGSKIYEVEEIKENRLEGAVEHLVEKVITAPMPGLVVKVNVKEGDPVEKGQILAIVEAMKMENQMRSPMNGKVKKIPVKPGDKVDANQVLVELELA